MTDYKLISADSHVSEPTDLWAERVEKKYRERAPRLMTNPTDPNGAYFYYEGYPLHPIGIGLGAGKSPEELAQFLTRGTYADARPGGWDPAERLKDNELDGVEADVLYTTLGFRLFWLKDAGLQQDCFRVYNDWLASYCSYAPKQMAGLAMICLYDPKAGAQELERCAKRGLKGAMIWCSPPPDQPYERARDAEIARRVREAIGGLTPDHRAVILLRELEGLSYEEISQVLDCPKGTVMSRLHYARRQLQARLRGLL